MYDDDDFEEYGQPSQNVLIDPANLPPGCLLYNGTLSTQNVTETAEYWGQPHIYQQNNVTFQCSPVDITVGAMESHGLSDGAMAGIIIGAVLGFAVIAFMLCICCMAFCD